MPWKVLDRSTKAEERRTLSKLLAASFEGYPLTEWVVGNRPAPGRRRERYFSLLLDEGFRHGHVLRDGGGQGVAVWFPPGRWAVGPCDVLRTLPDWLHVTGLRALSSRLRGLYALTQERPEGEAWILEVLGVHPSAQRRGIGTRLVEFGLEQARSDGVGAFLLTSSREAVPFYARLGFSVTNELAVLGGPPIWCLWHGP